MLDGSQFILISKKIGQQQLVLLDPRYDVSAVLIDDYYYQRFKIVFEQGSGIIIKILRDEKELFASEIYFGYHNALCKAYGNNHDFELNVEHHYSD